MIRRVSKMEDSSCVKAGSSVGAMEQKRDVLTDSADNLSHGLASTAAVPSESGGIAKTTSSTAHTAALQKDVEIAPATHSGLSLPRDDDDITPDDDANGENEEPILPTVVEHLGSGGDRKRALFSRYGLAYKPRRSSFEEPAAKIRRVEKPVRLRTHWTCHECNGHFSKERKCNDCGHRRCVDCTKQPPQRVKELLDQARVSRHEEQLREDGPSSAGGATTTIEASAALHASGVSVLQLLETDDNSDDGDPKANDTYNWIMQARPRQGHDIVQKKKTPSRQECEKPIASITPRERDSSNHQRCGECSQVSSKPGKQMEAEDDEALNLDLPENEEPRMVKTVQRVYRKVRQRVRYTCERCEATFLERSHCSTCGHQRCKGCVRIPAKKPPITRDPALLQALADRLASYESFDPRQRLATVAAV
ncbi:hypothetical protein LTR78_002046 [Recurvomyces mirabilis]|uniref:Uncharacterized protein n=1 Tax=Recurvomyces mirabilis TaxID=574656 RepID=A0AAE0WTP3_9PEZI|nr:hypothetical protein LTR78_002046 [Recurvomyces mirabilis]KAK5160504.1 hypothetical protein LTS14_001516 [Recurvomyces mirabilis]